MSDWRNNFRKFNAIKGWILDVYPSGPSQVRIWIIGENGERVKLVDNYVHRIYVAGNQADLEELTRKISDSESVADFRFVEKYADFMEATRKRVLEIGMTDYGRTAFFARKILRLGGYEKYQLYNVDVPIVQAYMYEKDIFPLAHVLAYESANGLAYELLDSVESCHYALPPLRSLSLNVHIHEEGPVTSFSDKIDTITLERDGESTVIDGGDEADKILRLVEAVRRINPDLIFTKGGDSFLLPYLAHRAFANGILDKFVLSREEIPLKAKKGKGRSYFSYGRVYYTAPLRRLYGRIHIDVQNTFIYAASGLEGLIEVSRTCRVPLHRAARASIGSIMTSLQLYTAWKDEILIPWKKREPESFKTAWEMLVADRGGFIFEPKIGFHTDVVEVDFTSMFPMLMLTRNISAETVLCKCCPNSRLRVPELGYNICEKRKGIVPKTLDLLLKKRLEYKRLMKEATDSRLKKAYEARQAALKWILVACFGYLGYRNARFGKVDAHIAVCAFARDALLKTARLAEQHGFEIVHGIVDSLWIKKPGVTPKEVVEFCREAERLVNVPLNVEGKYRWIVFLPSKIHPEVPVLNRYYGVFEDGRVKMRGIEARRADTPPIVKEAQTEMIKVLSVAKDYHEFVGKIPESLQTLKKYVDRILCEDVNPEELYFTKRLSKRPDEYAHSVFQVIAARQLKAAGFDVYAGQIIQYIIVDEHNRNPYKRVKAAQLLGAKLKFDKRTYLELLLQAAETLVGIFGYNPEKIRDLLIYGEKQLVLN
ncbi:MAG: DNA polymerase domain-containing protein [Candidatus Bathyarchaeales archaeon]